MFFGLESSKQNSYLVTTLCLVNSSLLSLSYYDRFSSLCFLLMFSESFQHGYSSTHAGSSRSFFLSGSLLSFSDVSPLLVSHVESPIPDFCRSVVQLRFLLSHEEEKQYRVTSNLILAESKCGIHSCGVGQVPAPRLICPTGTTGPYLNILRLPNRVEFERQISGRYVSSQVYQGASKDQNFKETISCKRNQGCILGPLRMKTSLSEKQHVL